MAVPWAWSHCPLSNPRHSEHFTTHPFPVLLSGAAFTLHTPEATKHTLFAATASCSPSWENPHSTHLPGPAVTYLHGLNCVNVDGKWCLENIVLKSAKEIEEWQWKAAKANSTIRALSGELPTGTSPGLIFWFQNGTAGIQVTAALHSGKCGTGASGFTRVVHLLE